MALDFGAGRAQFDNVQGGVHVEAKDGTRTVKATAPLIVTVQRFNDPPIR